MSIATLNGTLVAGPPGCGTGCFPSAAFTDSFGECCGRPFQASASSPSRYVNSPNAFADVPGIGSDVTRVDFLYLRSDGPIDLQLTTDDGVGGDVVTVESIQGYYIRDFAQAKPLKALGLRGNARVVYFASGPS